MSTPSELELGGKVPNVVSVSSLSSLTTESVLQKPRQHSLWRIWFGSCWLLGPGGPISKGQGGASASCQSCYPTCCSCSGMVQSGIITARSKTGRLQISSTGETRGAVESCLSHLSLDLSPTWLKFFFFFFFFFKGKGITHDEAYEHELCGAFVLLLSISQETDSRWRGSWRMRCNKRPVAVHGWLTPGSPPDQLHVLMSQSWHRNTLGYLVHEIVAANFRVSCNFKTLLSFVDSGGLCGENQRLLW